MNVIHDKLALKKLESGLPLIFQTDTLPAIGCLPKFAKIIYEIKKRDICKPLILMGAENSQLKDYVHESAKKDYENIASRYWPGALTMIIPISEKNRSVLTSKNFTLGLRIPKSEIAQSLLRKTGPLLTSSANISGTQGSITPDGLALEMPNIDILGPIPWDKCSGKASTIISWVKFGEWRLIRKGQISIKGLL